jgi:hypothetical protein
VCLSAHFMLLQSPDLGTEKVHSMNDLIEGGSMRTVKTKAEKTGGGSMGLVEEASVKAKAGEF